MADEFEASDDVLELTDVVEGEEGQAGDGEADDDIVLEGEEEAPADETPLQKKLRETTREALRRASTAEKRAADLERAANPPPQDPGAYPEFEDPQYEYDEERIKAAREVWHKQNNAYVAYSQRQASDEETRKKTITDLDIAYRTSVTRLAPASQAVFDQADKEFRELFGDDAPTALAAFFKEPSKLVVALHKYPGRRQAILHEPDNTKKLLLLKEVEMAIKSGSTRRAAPPPESETIQRGSAPLSSQPDKKSAELLAKAVKDNSPTAYRLHMRAQREKQRA